jgi:plasmid replication initiation protein
MAKKAQAKPGGQIKLIRKSNKLVEARYKFDIWEMRVFVKMISLIKPDDRDFAQYKISVHDIIQDFQLPNNGNYYKLLKEGAEKLLTKQVEIDKIDEDGKKKKVNLNLVSSTESFVDESDGNDVILKFDPELKKHLLDLKEQYLTYDVRNILKLTSVHSIRIYELLKQYEGMIGQRGFIKRKFEIEELKNTLGISKDEYEMYGHFKNKVILKAQKDLLEETDIRFDIEEEKSSRKVVAVIFVVYRNEKNQRKNKNAVEEVEEDKNDPKQHPEFQAVYSKVKEFVSEDVVSHWFSEFSINQIKAGVAYSLQQNADGKVNDMAKYLQTMVRTKTLFDQLEVKSAQEEEKKRKKDLLQKQKEEEKETEHKISEFKKQYYQAKQEVTLKLLNAGKDIHIQLLKKLKAEVAGGSNNLITAMALDRYQVPAGESAESLSVFIKNFENSGPFNGYVATTIADLFPDEYKPIREIYLNKAKALGLPESSVY